MCVYLRNRYAMLKYWSKPEREIDIENGKLSELRVCARVAAGI